MAIHKSNIIKVKALIQAMKDSRGNISESCAAVNIDRSTYYKWLKEDPKFAQAIDDVREANIDFVEGKLAQLVEGFEHKEKRIVDGVQMENTRYFPPHPTAVLFYLKTQAKQRGYIEQNNIGFAGDSPLVVNVASSDHRKSIEEYLNEDDDGIETD